MSEFILGDCMEYLPRYPDYYFDLAIVDPIYGDVSQGGYMNANNGKQVGKGAAIHKNYHLGVWKQEKTGADYFEELRRVSKNQIIWGGNYFSDVLPPSQGWIIWDKQHAVERSFADAELAWTSFNKATRIFRYMWDGMLQGDMANKEERIHPTQKPVALYSWILSRYAKKGDLILDTHAGSASSLVACYELGFDYVGFEIDPVYYEQANKRLMEAQKQIRIEDILKEEES